MMRTRNINYGLAGVTRATMLIAAVLLSWTAQAQSIGKSAGPLHESAVFDEEPIEVVRPVARAYYTEPEAAPPADNQNVGAEPQAAEPRAHITPGHAGSLQLAPVRQPRRIVPTSAVEAAEPENAAKNVVGSELRSLRLQPPKKSKTGGAQTGAMPSASTMIGSLAIVVGLFLLVAWVLRRGMPNQPRTLPPGILEVLGRAPLVGRQQVHLVRLGNKLLLLAITPSGIETLSEVTDPMEIDRLAGMCQQSSTHSSTKAFTQVLGELSDTRPAIRGAFSKAEPDFTGLSAMPGSLSGREKYRA